MCGASARTPGSRNFDETLEPAEKGIELSAEVELCDELGATASLSSTDFCAKPVADTL